ncbi:ATP12 family chaperone protein [Acetobacter fabarum]|uniref:ATP12 family chaperone protein n=1 Tax=Acetobacter fabarum TaxID=483199 RepID=UPI00312BA7FF
MPGRIPAGRKRFWKQVQLVPHEGGLAVSLDGRSVRLPGKTVLCVSSRALAEALVAEWQAAGQTAEGYFTPDDLPLTGMAGSMLERIPQARDGVVQSLLAYANSDLICYRDGAGGKLAQQQAALWDPWLAWLDKTYGATFQTTMGVMPIYQSDQALRVLGTVMSTMTDAQLAVLGVAVPALGSLVLGLALLGGARVEELVACATVDERQQMAVWGQDTEVTDRIARLQMELETAARFEALMHQA